MLTYSFDNTQGEPLYEHLYNCIKNDIVTGVIAPDEKLPSKRAFASHLNLSIITVENAYNQLMSEGFIYSRPRKGYFASDLSEISEYSLKKEYLLSSDSSSGANLELKKIFDKKHYYADFESNQTDPKSFPFSTWARLSRETLSNEKSRLMENSPFSGAYELRKAIAEFLKEFRGINASPEQIVIGAGTEVLFGFLIQFFGLHRKYAYESPGYSKIPQVLRSYKLEACGIPLDPAGINIDTLKDVDPDIVHTTPSHHFPTGITMSVGRRYDLLSWASDNPGRFIIEDDYDSEFRLKGHPLPPLYSIDIGQRVIYMNTFTKTLSSTIRINYMVLPPRLMTGFAEMFKDYSCTVPNFEQYTLARFIEDGFFEKHINRMRNSYKKRRDLLMNEIRKSPLGNISVISEENSGLHFILSLDSRILNSRSRTHLNKTLQSIINTASESGIRIGTLPEASSDSEISHKTSFLVNYSSIPDERIPEAVKRLSDAVVRSLK